MADDPADAADMACRAIDRAAHSGNRVVVADAVALAILVFAGRADSFEAAAAADGALHGPALVHIPPLWTGIHQPRIDAALEHVATTLGDDAFGAAQQRGAAMTYDEIIAYTLDQLAEIADT
jgi:hypothetical protein